jgi:hypothetical protein
MAPKTRSTAPATALNPNPQDQEDQENFEEAHEEPEHQPSIDEEEEEEEDQPQASASSQAPNASPAPDANLGPNLTNQLLAELIRTMRNNNANNNPNVINNAINNALNNSNNNAAREKEPEVNDPVSFDGSDKTKLRTFLSQVSLVFLTRPARYNTERKKVLFAASYLSGPASAWFVPFSDVTKPSPLWLDNYVLFTEELQRLFGDPNYIATAERNLRRLRMREDSSIATYNTKFESYATDLAWNDSALYSHYKHGLAERIQDDLLHHPKPQTLTQLKELAVDIDNRHHERLQERSNIKASTTVPVKSNVITTTTSSSSSSPKPPRFSQLLKPPSNASKNASRSSKSPAPSNPVAKNLTNDGKLKDSVREQRIKDGACLYCGEKGHGTQDCPVLAKKNTSNPASTSNNKPNTQIRSAITYTVSPGTKNASNA